MNPGVKTVPVDATYSLTVYPQSCDPIPIGAYDEYGALSWKGVMDLLAPNDVPRLMEDKRRLWYYTSGVLSDGEIGPGARFILSRRQKKKVVVGKARGKNCVRGPFNLLVFDVDGVTKQAFDWLRANLDKYGVDYLSYSTFSQGSPNKPGWRFRVVLPMHPPVDPDQYQAIHKKVQDVLLGDVRQGIDPSCKYPWQQQGCWATKPELAGYAFKLFRSKGYVLDSSFWLQKAYEAKIATATRINHIPPSRLGVHNEGSDVLSIGLRRALLCIPARTRYFQKLLMFMKALESATDSYQLFHEWAWSDPEHQAAQQAQRSAYDPAVAWVTARPSLAIEAAVGSVHQLAREVAITNVKSDPSLQREASKQAATYLFVHHRKHFDKLWSELFCQDSSGGSSSGVNSKETA